MNFVSEFKNDIFQINEETFENSSLEVFEFQYHECKIYQQYCDYLGKKPSNVHALSQIPFLPIEFFKNHEIKSGEWMPEKVFKSSGTTSDERSQHLIPDLSFYHRICKKTFTDIFGDLQNVQILALLPSYIEKGDSSLISMVDHLMSYSAKDSGYFLESDLTQQLETSSIKKILFGVSYALLDLAEKNITAEECTIIETGGMKGRKKELTRAELHHLFTKTLAPKTIWSEYGMTELQSQAYGENGQFHLPSWSKALIRDINDPFSYVDNGMTGGINIIDLANVQTCAFIETKDLGKAQKHHFEVLGRFDNSDIRGCNLLI